MKMIKKAVSIIVILSLLFVLSGCWSYRGLNELSIVAGMAIDKDPENDNIKLTFEIIDLTGTIKESGSKSKILESEGVTIFDAVRNAKNSCSNKLYFSDAKEVILSEQVAREDGIARCLDWFFRDNEPRETLDIVIAKGTKAKDSLLATTINQSIVSFELNKIITGDEKVTSATHAMKLYEVNEALSQPGKTFLLPTIIQKNGDKGVINSLGGAAIFKDGFLKGYLTPNEVKSYLFIIDEIQGGILTINEAGETRDNMTMEIYKNDTKTSVQHQDNQFKATIETKTDVYLGEFENERPILFTKQTAGYEELAQEQLSEDITALLQKAQQEWKIDIFGFGNMIYRKNPKLWMQISDQWDELFLSMEFEVKPHVNINNTVNLKK